MSEHKRRRQNTHQPNKIKTNIALIAIATALLIIVCVLAIIVLNYNSLNHKDKDMHYGNAIAISPAIFQQIFAIEHNEENMNQSIISVITTNLGNIRTNDIIEITDGWIMINNFRFGETVASIDINKQFESISIDANEIYASQDVEGSVCYDTIKYYNGFDFETYKLTRSIDEESNAHMYIDRINEYIIIVAYDIDSNTVNLSINGRATSEAIDKFLEQFDGNIQKV